MDLMLVYERECIFFKRPEFRVYIKCRKEDKMNNSGIILMTKYKNQQILNINKGSIEKI